MHLNVVVNRVAFWVALLCLQTSIMVGCTKVCPSCPDDGNDTIPVNWNDTVTDLDGNVYHPVRIGTQVWMVENLKTTKYRDGTAIPLVPDSAAWRTLETPGYCWCKNDSSNKALFGALYNWYAVKTGKLAPAGWHVPSDPEWMKLITYLGGFSVAGGKLKEAGEVHWTHPNTGATNSSGFTALPGSARSYWGRFYSVGGDGTWWSASPYGSGGAWGYWMIFSKDTITRDPYRVLNGFSVRCVRD